MKYSADIWFMNSPQTKAHLLETLCVVLFIWFIGFSMIGYIYSQESEPELPTTSRQSNKQLLCQLQIQGTFLMVWKIRFLITNETHHQFMEFQYLQSPTVVD